MDIESSSTRFTRSKPESPLFRLVWPLTSPLRRFVVRPPQTSAKTFLARRLLPSILPPAPAGLDVEVPGGGHVRIEYQEEIALLLLLQGAYETSEIEAAARLVRAGWTAIDVGANVGLYTVTLALAAGPRGAVLAFEPIVRTADRLRSNLARNAIENVRIVPAAAGASDGSIDIRLADDSAYASTVTVKGHRATGEGVRVPMTTLDRVWHDEGEPDVSFCKIDVEGAELDVLRGAEQVIATCRPALLLEADEGPQLAGLETWLGPRGYRRRPMPGFSAWNHLFVHDAAGMA